MVISWISGMNRELFHFDCVFQYIEDQDNLKKLENMGCEVYEMPLRYRQLRERNNFFKKIMSQKEYSIVHVHTVCAIDYQALRVAKKLGIPMRIAHSHGSSLGNSQFFLNSLHKISRLIISRYATHCLACSTEAGINLYGKFVNRLKSKFSLVHDGIDTEHYRYDSEAREHTRKQLGISDDQILLGCIARYDPMKRQDFVVDVLRECCRVSPTKFHLLLIGDGGTKPKIEQQVKEYGLEQNVTFIPNTFKVPSYLSAMDVMVFPSVREGLGLVLVEAQCSGLPCITTDQIPKEAKLTENFVMLPIGAAASLWKDTIISMADEHSLQRHEAYQIIQQQGYDISYSVNQLQMLYFSATDM